MILVKGHVLNSGSKKPLGLAIREPFSWENCGWFQWQIDGNDLTNGGYF